MRLRALCAATAALALSAIAQAQPLGLKKATLGMSLAEFRASFHRQLPDHDKPAPPCSDTHPTDFLIPSIYAESGLVACREHFSIETYRDRISPTIAGVPAAITYLFLPDATNQHRLFTIEAFFARASFETVINALTVKYGPPTIISQSFQWPLSSGAITAEEYSNRTGEARVVIYDPAANSRLRERQAEAIRSRAADL